MKSFFCLLLVVICFCFFGCNFKEQFMEYKVTDIGQYQEVRKTKYYQKVEKYSDLVMPDAILPFFEIEKYSFKYDPMDGKYEEYLEILINDEQQYQQYIDELLNGNTMIECPFDSVYQQYVVNEKISYTENSRGEQCFYMASVQKILTNDNINSIIFVSFSIPSDYGAVELNWFEYCQKFDILAIDL